MHKLNDYKRATVIVTMQSLGNNLIQFSSLNAFDCELKYRHVVVCAAILSKLSIGNVR